MVRLRTLSWSSIVLFAAAAATVACSGSGSGDGGSRWDCHGAVVPLGHTLECVAQDDQALTSDGVSSDDGPAYFCAPGATESAACPPPNAGATSDATGASGSGSGSGASGAGTSDGTAAGGATSTTGGSGSTAGSGAGAGDGRDDLATGTMDGTSDTSSGTGGASGTGAGAGTSAGGSGGAATSGGTSDGTGGGFYCTHQHGKRYCRREPICDAGAHRLQMDCEPDATSGFGGGTGSGSGGGAGGGTASGGYPGAGTGDATGGMPGAQRQCYYASGATPGASVPAATFEYVIETFSGAQALHTRLTFNPAFVDNSYGTTSVGWGSHVHQFKELVGSDHAELSFSDTAGTEKLHFKLDYISQSATAPSGYASLGVTGGEGRMIVGSASSVLQASSSLDRNLNERGYASYVVDSPPTDASYTPSAAAPAWDYRVVYEAWIANDAFGAAGFGAVKLTYVHASPSKATVNTLTVVEGPCPPGF